MKFMFFFLVFLIISHFSFSQMSKVNDSLLNEICNTLLSNRDLADTIRLEEIKSKHISPVIDGIEKPNQKDAANFIAIHLLRNCKEFRDISMRLYPNKEELAGVNEKPISALDKMDCQDFIKIGKYYYIEATGDTVHLTIENNIWEDHFLDGTYSKLKFVWVNDCEFEIEFIESNNPSRKSFSRPGDKYRYQILQKGDGNYQLSVEIVGTDQFFKFKMYY
jgi:hypothetical protein